MQVSMFVKVPPELRQDAAVFKSVLLGQTSFLSGSEKEETRKIIRLGKFLIWAFMSGYILVSLYRV